MSNRKRPLAIDISVNVHSVAVVPRLMKQKLAPIIFDSREVGVDVNSCDLDKIRFQ